MYTIQVIILFALPECKKLSYVPRNENGIKRKQMYNVGIAMVKDKKQDVNQA